MQLGDIQTIRVANPDGTIREGKLQVIGIVGQPTAEADTAAAQAQAAALQASVALGQP